MIVTVASGKGGTGKTTFAVALTKSAPNGACLLDCDVEEPNAHIFLKLQDVKEEPVTVTVPYIDEEKCALCGECSKVCEFNAIAVLKTEAMIFDELCHSCGGCIIACPNNAIYEKDKKIGTMTSGIDGDVEFYEGKIDIGHALVPPIIRNVRKHAKKEGLTIIDSPPGTACPAVTSMNGSDYIILVTEATPFGLHDLKLSVDVVREINIPFGVIINRCDTGDSGVADYLKEENIKLLLEVPEDMEIAKAYSRGETLISAVPELKDEMARILEAIERGAL